jgi:hypothetical protein
MNRDRPNLTLKGHLTGLRQACKPAASKPDSFACNLKQGSQEQEYYGYRI